MTFKDKGKAEKETQDLSVKSKGVKTEQPVLSSAQEPTP